MMRRLIYGICWLFFVMHVASYATFSSIAKLVAYAETLPEFPEDEYIDPYKPRYHKLHASLKPSTFDKVRSKIGIGRDQLFDDIQKRLQKLTSERELLGYYGNFIQKFYIDVETKWYIWGSLHGAFHSLVRALVELNNQGVIGDDLKILKSRFNFVFNGNILNYAPYQLETLSVIITLMEQNPEHVFVCKGDFESDEHWKETNLPFELKGRLPFSKNEKIPLGRELDRFFNTLPLAIYLVSTDLDILRISFFEKHQLLNESKWGSFLNEKSDEHIKIDAIEPSDTDVTIRAYLLSHQAQQFPYKIEEVSYKRLRNAHEWRFFSSPILLFKTMFGFYSDVAIVLTTGKFFSNWRLELYSQNTKEKKGFIRSREFNVATGKEEYTANQQEQIAELKQKIELAQLERKRLKKECAERLKDATSRGQNEKKTAVVDESDSKKDRERVLVVGSMADFSKGSRDWSTLLKKGLSLPIQLANRNGGVDGTLIRLVFLDDQYAPELARKNALKFLSEFKTDIVLGAKGTPTLASYIDLVKDKKLLAVFPNTGGFRDPNITYLLHLRASYVDEGKAITQYVVDNASKVSRDTRFAFMYQNDDYGKDLLNGALEVLNAAGFTQIEAIPYASYMVDFSRETEQLKAFKPDVIGFFSLPDATQRIIKEVGVRYLSDKTLFGNDRLGNQLFKDFLAERGLVIMTPQVVPNPQTSMLPIAVQFREEAQKYNVPVDVVSFESYIASSIFLDLLHSLDGAFEKDTFVRAFEALDNYNFKGLNLRFDPETRQLSHTVWIDTGSGDWLPQIMKPRQKESVEGMKQEKILVLGNTSDFSKTLASWSEGLRDGLMVPIKKVNNAGGVNGYNMQVIFLDDQYDPAIARKNVQKLIDQFKVSMLLGSMGTPTLDGYLDLVKEKKIATVFPNTGSYRDADLDYAVFLRASNYQLGYAVTSYVHKEKAVDRFAFVYQDDAFGRQMLQGAQAYLKEVGLEDALALPHKHHETDYSMHAEELEKYKPGGIGLFTNTLPIELIIKELGAKFLLGKAIFGSEVLGYVKEFLAERGVSPIVPAVVPNPEESSLPIAKEFRRDINAARLKQNVATFEGYINGLVFIDLIQKINGPINKESFFAALDQMKEYDFKGLKLSFDAKTRQLMHSIWIDDGKKDWHQITLK